MNGYNCNQCSVGKTSPNFIQTPIQSWFDLENMMPRCPLELIAWASISGAATAFTRSSSFFASGGAWITSPFSIGPNPPACVALGSDQLQNVADAQQWNFQHLTANLDSSVAPPLLKVLFLRGGTEWKNQISIDLGAATYNDLQLTFRDNAATRGDAQGTVPVIAFTGGALTGNIVLEVVLKMYGNFTMGL